MEGWGCLLQTLDTTFLLRPRNPIAGRRGEWDLQGSGRGASVHYGDLVGLQTWQPTFRFGNPRHVAVTGVCVDAVGSGKWDFSWTAVCARRLMHSLTHKHSEPSLATQNSSAHWFWLGVSIIGYWGEMIDCGSMGLAQRAAQRPESGTDSNIMAIFHWRATLLDWCYVGLMMYYKSNLRSWWDCAQLC